jgi:hypothetical protein
LFAIACELGTATISWQCRRGRGFGLWFGT